MIDFKVTFESREKEISDFLKMMKFLESKQNEKQDDTTSFDLFFDFEETDVQLSYQVIINIMKSNASLMIYNIIEFTVSNLIDIIYDAIKLEQLDYISVNSNIQELWRRIILKSVNDPNANFNTFIKKNEEIVDFILQNKTIELQARHSLPGGNLDGQSIVETFHSHGISINKSSSNFRPDVLATIKDQRNRLAHGSVSFVEALRDETIDDIGRNKDFIISFLRELVENVSNYIQSQNYKHNR